MPRLDALSRSKSEDLSTRPPLGTVAELIVSAAVLGAVLMLALALPSFAEFLLG